MNKDRIKILIVEDSPEWIKYHITLLNSFLEEGSFEIEFEMSAREGFNKVLKSHDNCYDLIISDLEMEDINGESYAGSWFIRNILKRKECENTKILIISGSPDIQRVAKDLNVDFIPKHVLSNNPIILSYKLEEILTSGSI